MIRLGRLLEEVGLPAPPGADAEVGSVHHDSRHVEPGALFVAIPGERFDGRDFAAQAGEAGAVAVVGRGDAPDGLGVPWIAADDPRALLGPLAARVYGRPDREMTMVGVTGTNGKSTVAWILESVLGAAGTPCALLGSITYRFGGTEMYAPRTTPEASDLFRLLREVRDHGAEAVAMEVSSHGLALGRVGELRFDAAVFTNLTRDHLDFHRTMESYFEAKKGLFGMLREGGAAAVNVGDPWGRRLAEELPAAITFGEGGVVAPRQVTLDEQGIRGTLATPRGDFAFETRLLGRYNLLNLLAAVATAEGLGLHHEAVRHGLAAVEPVPGRLQSVDAGQPFPVFIDYAHSDDALRAVLESVRELTGRQVVVVFGCGGDRDSGKRPRMGETAGRLADLVIVTADNPRSEDPQEIMSAIEGGLKTVEGASYRMIPDRRDAIRRALSVAGPEWAVVVAGKGSETGQDIGGVLHPFSDKEEILAALEERHGDRHPG